MGANNTRRVSFEADENENITVVKGIRLSENVIKRMREPEELPKKPQPPTPPPRPSAPTLDPSLLRPVPPLFDPITSLPPPPPPPLQFATETVPPPPPPPVEQVAAPTIADTVSPADAATASALEPVASPPPPPPAAAPAVETVTLPSSLHSPTPLPCPASAEVQVITPLVPPLLNQSMASPPSGMEPFASPPVIEPIVSPPVIEPIAASAFPEPDPSPPPAVIIKPITAPLPDSQSFSAPDFLKPVSSFAPQPAEPIAAPPLLEFTAPSEPVAPPSQPKEEPVRLDPVPESEAVPLPSHVTPPAPPAAPAVDEEALRKKISDELSQGFEQQKAKAEQELQAWLEKEKARASASAQAEARSQVQDEVSRILSVERAVAQESLQQAIVRERIATEDEKLRAQLFAKQLEAREADLKKQDAFYREQVARLEERSAQFYKVTTENYHKAADDVNSKFRRYEVYPVCTDLQGQILACYKENVGKTLNCSGIAALYLQCVNNAKKNKVRTGG